MSTRTKLHQGIRRYQASHPHATILLVEPREDEGDMFLHNPMSFTSRRRMLRYGYESTARQLPPSARSTRRRSAPPACASTPRSLQTPWELTA